MVSVPPLPVRRRRRRGRLLVLVLILVGLLVYTSRSHRTAHRVWQVPTDPAVISEQSRRIELSSDPLGLFDPHLSSLSFRLYGVGIGSPRSAVPRNKVLSDNGMQVQCIDGNCFDVAGGQITRISIYDPNLLQRLAIRRRTDIAARLGAPYSTYTDGPAYMTVFDYPRRGIAVRWDDSGRTVNRITLSEPRI